MLLSIAALDRDHSAMAGLGVLHKRDQVLLLVYWRVVFFDEGRLLNWPLWHLLPTSHCRPQGRLPQHLPVLGQHVIVRDGHRQDPRGLQKGRLRGQGSYFGFLLPLSQEHLTPRCHWHYCHRWLARRGHQGGSH